VRVAIVSTARLGLAAVHQWCTPCTNLKHIRASAGDIAPPTENTRDIMATVPVPLELPLLLVRNSATVSREIAGETIVVPICAGVGDMESVYTFNEMGGHLWKLLAESRPVGDLVAWVVRNFEVAPEVAAEDVRAFLEDLRSIGLVESVGLDLREAR
jgi:Coenzyme PQQ synthesis protein D (PqqD)